MTTWTDSNGVTYSYTSVVSAPPSDVPDERRDYGPYKLAYDFKYFDVSKNVFVDYSNYEIRYNETSPYISVHSKKSGNLVKSTIRGQVTLSKDGVESTFTLALAWKQIACGPPPMDGNRYCTVDHIDRDHINNHPFNLGWATQRQQCLNRAPYTRKYYWEKLDDVENQLQRYEFESSGRYFVRIGFEVKQFDGCWYKKMGMVPNKENGYIYVQIDGRGFRMNRMIAHTIHDYSGRRLIDIYDDSVIVDHIDEDPTNNNVDNLRICTQKENTKAHHARGLAKTSCKAIWARPFQKNGIYGNDMPVQVFESVKRAAEVLFDGKNSTSISNVIHKRRRQAGGYVFGLVSNDD